MLWGVLRALATLLLLLLAGCGAPPAGSDRTLTTNTADGDRTALVHRPATARPGAPLVVVMHGARGTGATARSRFGWDALADEEGFVVAYPDGLDRTWNAGTCCGTSAARGVDDVGYLHGLVARLAAEEGIDLHRVIAAGFSNGAMMAYAWACARPGDLAGIGPVAGQLLVPCAQPGPLPVVAVHGLADDRVRVTDPPPGQPTAQQSIAPFRAGCAEPPAVDRDAPATITTWTCPGGRTVTLDLIDGFGHAWPDDAAEFLWARLRP
ncbi:alpha/beta hydrolase family esterase [Pseudonocardia sp. CA-107938]|uniref:alpha/beta hydrolase family esterase n=1 Tax=Pseudonocardia sp. CA-107938 TaxID=3240021 RepID=UPI003D8A7344